MEEALHDVPLYRKFVGLAGWTQRLPDETSILRFRHLLQKHKRADVNWAHRPSIPAQAQVIRAAEVRRNSRCALSWREHIGRDELASSPAAWPG